MRGQYRNRLTRVTPVEGSSHARNRAKMVLRFVAGIKARKLHEACPVERWNDAAWRAAAIVLDERLPSVETRADIVKLFRLEAEAASKCGWCRGDLDGVKTLESPVVGRIHASCNDDVKKAIGDGVMAQIRADGGGR